MTPSAVIDLMDAFAERTGSSSGAEPRRYLWTDAFAVINFLEFHRQSPTWQDHRDINEVMLATALLKAQVGTAVINQAADEG